MKGMFPTLGWVVVGIALIVSLGIDLANTWPGGAIDLRNRITGLRLLEHGIDAYHYKWREGEPEEYADVFNNPKLPVSKTTATPALLLLNLPIAWMSYGSAQMTWFLAQWLLLLGVGWLWLRACTAKRQRWAVAILVIGFTYTAAWRLHAERGQAYVVLAFLFAAWLILTARPVEKWNGPFAAGCIAGILIALRPPFALLLPFLALHRRGQFAGVAVGLLVGVGAPLLVNPHDWSDYFAAMQTHSELYRNDIDPRPGPQHYPAEIEGISTDTIAHLAVIPYADSSAFTLLKYLGLEHGWLGDEAIPAWPLLFFITLLFASWLWLSHAQPMPTLLPALAAWLFLVDFFLPAYRDSYNDVLILDVIAVTLITTTRISWIAWPCALALPIGWAIYIFAPEQAGLINLPTILFLLNAILAIGLSTFLFNNRAESRKVAAAC
jgi:Glycosyltransferase family 87